MKRLIAITCVSAALLASCASAEPSCDNPEIGFTPEQRVLPGAFIRWRPADCPMVIETWRNGTDCKKIGVTDSQGGDSKQARSCDGQGLQDVGVLSGDVTIEQMIGDKKGRIEIKIWVPNQGKNKSVFVNVQ